jgi:hypothetical protein
MPKFIAHIGMRPINGEDAYTVETEFTATSYPTAWAHVQKVAAGFQATVGTHRIQQISEDGEITDPPPIIVAPLDADRGALASARRPPLALPAPPATSPGNVAAPAVMAWLGAAKVAMPKVLPFPIEENANDTAAA